MHNQAVGGPAEDSLVEGNLAEGSPVAHNLAEESPVVRIQALDSPVVHNRPGDKIRAAWSYLADWHS